MRKVEICPVCGLSIEKSDITKVCPSCEITHHITCWDRNIGCSTFACPEGPKPLVARPGYVLCKACGEECIAGKKFCSKCGSKLEIPAPNVNANVFGIDEQNIFDPNICGKCGATDVGGKNFCPRCGNKLGVTQSVGEMAKTIEPNICKTCGAPLKEGNKFCTKCGAPIL